MGASKKKLCKYSKSDIVENLVDLKEMVFSPRFICRKCIRISDNKACLCKPEKLEKESPRNKNNFCKLEKLNKQ